MERNENGRPSRHLTGAGKNPIEEFFDGGCKAENGGAAGSENGENGNTGTDIDSDFLPLAYAYVPWQKWRKLYSPEAGLSAGTLFEELNKPLGVYGNE